MAETNLFILFLSGFLGGGHCAGMCGGIVTALSLDKSQKLNHWGILLGYNVGRIISYTLIGALLGGLAEASLLLTHTQSVRLALYIMTNIIIISVGLYLAGLSSATMYLEHLGRPLWQRLHPYLARQFPIRTFYRATVAGAIWGWLPCGLVYSASLSALATARWIDGALVMLVFGLGTLPNLLAMGFFAGHLKIMLQKRPVRLAAGLTIVVLGVIQLAETVLFA